MTIIYLSSTYTDLKDHRRTVAEDLRKNRYEIIAMEDYVARDNRPVDACLQDVDRADVYVGVFAFRYGYIPPTEHGNPDGLSITELEYRRAVSQGKTCLVFLADENAGWPQSHSDTWTGEGDGGMRIKRLRQYFSQEKLSSFFTSPDHLARLVLSAIHLSHSAKPPAPPAITWDIARHGSPYPGLAHFTRRFAPVYFGRDTEVNAVLDRFSQPDARFMIISGDSGTGKSSLVDAGVLPRLQADAHTVYMLPSQGEHLFDALLRALHEPAQQAGLHPYELTKALANQPEDFVPSLERIIQRGLAGKQLVVFIDQLEEIFLPRASSKEEIGRHTGMDCRYPEHREVNSATALPGDWVPAIPAGTTSHGNMGTILSEAGNRDVSLVQSFLTQLYRATQALPMRVIATIRSDWLHHCYAHADLLKVLRSPGHYPLGPVAPWLLHDLIAKPAACAGLDIAEELVRRLIEDAGSEPGNLPLLAFVLEALFNKRQGKVLSATEYDRMGGLTGAIAQHITTVEAELAQTLGAETLQTHLSGLFRQLIHLNAESLPSRRRVSRASLERESLATVDALVRARILTAEGLGVAKLALPVKASLDTPGTITLAHERLAGIWPKLKSWIDRSRDDLHLLRQVRLEAAHWDAKGRPPAALWPHELLQDMPRMVANLQPELTVAEWVFIRPEAERLLEEIQNPATTHYRRAEIGDRLAMIGDPRPGVGLRADGLPDIAWVEIPGGTVVLEEDKGKFEVQPFQIARYPVTYLQYQAFLEAKDGYRNQEWWQGFPTERKKQPGEQYRRISNCPAENVSWYDAVAFCRWLGFRLSCNIRLPTEWEWQQAATSGRKDFEYPWGPEWQEAYVNSDESHLGRTIAVGMYPQGQSKLGVFDLAGNVWEWCLNEYEKPGQTGFGTGAGRVLRGGSWYFNARFCRSASRSLNSTDFRSLSVGFRCARVQS